MMNPQSDKTRLLESVWQRYRGEERLGGRVELFCRCESSNLPEMSVRWLRPAFDSQSTTEAPARFSYWDFLECFRGHVRVSPYSSRYDYSFYL